MPKSFAPLATISFVVALLLSGCSAATDGTEGEPQQSASAQLEQLKSEGKIPASFTAEPLDLRVEVDGEEFGISWKGQPLTEDCVPGEGRTNSTVALLMLQDVGIEDVQQCGNVWQATQADGSYIAWNAAP